LRLGFGAKNLDTIEVNLDCRAGNVHIRTPLRHWRAFFSSFHGESGTAVGFKLVN